MNFHGPRVLMGTPAFGGQLTGSYVDSVLRLQKACLEEGSLEFNVLEPRGDSLVTRSRQNIVARFMEDPNSTHLLFADSDIGFEPEQVFRLVRFDVDMAAAVYPLKRFDFTRIKPFDPAAGTPSRSSFLTYDVELEESFRNTARNGFAKALQVGAGFMLIKREVFAAMFGHYPELKYSGAALMNDPLARNPFRYALFNCMIDEATGAYLGDDASFCRRWRNMGGEIWVDLESRLRHVGTVSFEGDMGRRETGERPESP
jgi:hypothetical protein